MKEQNDRPSDQISMRITSLEESLVSGRPAYSEYSIQTIETDDGNLFRILNPEGQCVSPMFFSLNCLNTYLTRLPLLTFEEWDKFPVQADDFLQTDETINGDTDVQP